MQREKCNKCLRICELGMQKMQSGNKIQNERRNLNIAYACCSFMRPCCCVLAVQSLQNLHEVENTICTDQRKRWEKMRLRSDNMDTADDEGILRPIHGEERDTTRLYSYWALCYDPESCRLMARDFCSAIYYISNDGTIQMLEDSEVGDPLPGEC